MSIQIRTGESHGVLQRSEPVAKQRRGLARRAWLLFTLLALLVVPTVVRAQEASLTVEVASLTTGEEAGVQAVVAVLGEDGRPVSDLTTEAFVVQLDGQVVPITTVSQGVDSTLGIAVVLALDVSHSMEGAPLDQAKAAAQSFLDGLGPQDSVAVVAFGHTVVSVLGFTQDRAAVAAAINNLTIAAVAGTALYDATVESLSQAAGAETNRRAVVLLTDGLDYGSDIPRAEALATSEPLGVPLFTIGLGNDIDAGYLEELAQMSGGQFDVTPSPEGLAQLYQGVAELLRGQYVLSLDLSGLSFDETAPATLRIDVTIGEQTGSGERDVCLQQICVGLSEAEGTFTAQVISAEPVVSVIFLLDGEQVAELSEPPYLFTYDPMSVADGDHTVEAKATTADGAIASGSILLSTGGVDLVNNLDRYLPAGAVAVGAVLIAFLLLRLLRSRRKRETQQETPIEPPTRDGPEEEPAPQAPEPPPAGEEAIQHGALRQLWDQTPTTEKPPPAVVEEPLGALRVVSGPLAGQTFTVGGAPVSIGSGHRCLIRLPVEEGSEEEIAPELARVWIRDKQLMVHELMRLTVTGSVGGGWSILAPGESFNIGPYSFKFELDGYEAPEETSPAPIPNVLREAGEAPPDSPPPPQGAPAPSEGGSGEPTEASQPSASSSDDGGTGQETLPDNPMRGRIWPRD